MKYLYTLILNSLSYTTSRGSFANISSGQKIRMNLNNYFICKDRYIIEASVCGKIKETYFGEV